jgi:hypothetical protein
MLELCNYCGWWLFSIVSLSGATTSLHVCVCVCLCMYICVVCHDQCFSLLLGCRAGLFLAFKGFFFCSASHCIFSACVQQVATYVWDLRSWLLVYATLSLCCRLWYWFCSCNDSIYAYEYTRAAVDIFLAWLDLFGVLHFPSGGALPHYDFVCIYWFFGLFSCCISSSMSLTQSGVRTGWRCCHIKASETLTLSFKSNKHTYWWYREKEKIYAYVQRERECVFPKNSVKVYTYM